LWGIQTVVFRAVTVATLVGEFQQFRGIYGLYFAGDNTLLPKYYYLPHYTVLQTQMITIWIIRYNIKTGYLLSKLLCIPFL
jgi:hypothetical protein